MILVPTIKRWPTEFGLNTLQFVMDFHFPIVVSGTFTNHGPVQFAGHQRFGQRFFSVLPYKSIATYGAEQESITHHHTN